MGMVSAARYWVADDLDTLPADGNRYEVIDGELLVTPAPSLDHQEAIAQLHLRLVAYIAAHECGHVVFAPADVRFSQRRSVQPDLFVMPRHEGRRPRRFSDVAQLLLAVEVLSPTTARSDRVRKRKVYGEEAVGEYWIVDLDARVIERTRGSDRRPEVLSERLEWTPPGAGEPFVLDVERYFADVMDDLPP